MSSEFVSAALNSSVAGFAFVSLPSLFVEVVGQVRAENYADVVKLETLGGIDTTYLVDAVWAVSPVRPP